MILPIDGERRTEAPWIGYTGEAVLELRTALSPTKLPASNTREGYVMPKLNKQTYTILITAVVVLVFADKIRALPLVNKLPTL